jgi:aminopeptidase N
MTWRLMEQFTVTSLQLVMIEDSLPDTHAMTHEVGSPDEIDATFDNIAYTKGSFTFNDVIVILMKVFHSRSCY